MEKTPRRKKNVEFSGGDVGSAGDGSAGVTGVSRSGRVRKKSSKLMDFESPDDVTEARHKRGPPAAPPPPRPTPPPHHRRAVLERPHQVNVKMEADSEDMEYERPDQLGSASESDSEVPDGGPDDSSLDSDDDDEDLDQEMISPDNTGSPTRRDDPQGRESGTQAQSLYMLEKSTKKRLVIRDGKIVGRMKAQRKDKGKTRFTAYMLWAKEIRSELIRANPDLDFATMSKRLGELWATVPNNEKYNWKRRAKRLAVKGDAAGVDSAAVVDTTRWKTPPSKSKFINMNKGGGKGGGSAAQKAARILQLGTASVVGNVPISPPDTKTGKGAGGGLVADPVVGPGLYKVVGTQPVDVAAHLKLLGDSLTIIGERLQEHEGQIAVSGSLSVLLDSLLCALGPLLCLSQQIPEADGCPPDLLHKVLDNIAYFMPGL